MIIDVDCWSYMNHMENNAHPLANPNDMHSATYIYSAFLSQLKASSFQHSKMWQSLTDVGWTWSP